MSDRRPIVRTPTLAALIGEIDKARVHLDRIERFAIELDAACQQESTSSPVSE